MVAAWIGVVPLHVFAEQLELAFPRVLREVPRVMRRLLLARAALALEMRDEVGLDAGALRVGRAANEKDGLAPPEHVHAAPLVRRVLHGCGGERPLRAPQRHCGLGDATVLPQRRRPLSAPRAVTSARPRKDYPIHRSTYRAMRS